MNILYLTSACSQTRFDSLVAKGKITKMPQAQKYHHLLLEGLRKNTQDSIIVISSYPIVTSKGRFFNTEHEIENGIEYYYPAFISLPVLRQFCLWVDSVRLIFSSLRKDTIIVCDVLNRSVCYAARFTRFFKRKLKIVGIVTDVPGFTSGARRKMLPKWKQMTKKFISSLTKNDVHAYDGYLLLTEAMNGIVNSKGKPYIVIEGHSDIGMRNRENKLENKYQTKTIMYAGGTHKEFGIAMLVEAFIAVNDPEWELHIYGDGNYQETLKKISMEHSNVQYFGMHPNAEIVDAQLKAWLLVNPRITNAEYVKYSFPSKTLECMVSGTPLLTTRLAGMPKDYYPYVYLIEDETQKGFEAALRMVFEESREKLHQRGAEAKDFALNKKNNVKQAELFYHFLESLR